MADNADLKKLDSSNLLLLAILFVAFFLVFFPTWAGLFNAWASSEDYSHGFLIVPLSIYILWQKRFELQAVPIASSWSYFPFVFLSLLFYLLARYAGILTLAPIAMIFFISAGILFLTGTKILKVCFFPLLLLFFMIPVPGQIYAALTIPLQLMVTKAAVFISMHSGIPILREGNVIYLPEHTLQVVQACSGLRSIMSLLTLGAVIAYFGVKSNFFKLLLFIAAIPIAILVNVVRVLIMVVAFYYLDIDLTVGTTHTIFGMLVFILAIGLFLLLRKVFVLWQK